MVCGKNPIPAVTLGTGKTGVRPRPEAAEGTHPRRTPRSGDDRAHHRPRRHAMKRPQRDGGACVSSFTDR